MEPLYNGQVGAGAFVRYSEVSFIHVVPSSCVRMRACMLDIKREYTA